MEELIARADGSLEIHLTDIEANAVRHLAQEMLEHLDEPPGEDVRRLFPPAYPDDPKLQDEFSSVTYDELMHHKKEAARAVLGTIEAGQMKRGAWTGVLDRAAVYSWVSVVNDARLVLGTRLAVTEEMDHDPLPPDHPDAPSFNMYLYLGGLEELLVHYLLEHDLENTPGGD